MSYQIIQDGLGKYHCRIDHMGILCWPYGDNDVYDSFEAALAILKARKEQDDRLAAGRKETLVYTMPE